MTNPYDYGETVPIHADYYDKAGAPTAQTGATVAVTDSAGTVQQAATAMTEDATGIYSYNYVTPAAGPAGVWSYTTVGTDASGHEITNTVSFVVKAVVTPYTIPDTVRDILPDLLVADDDIGTVSSGTSITLTNSVFGVPSIIKDTTTLYDSTDYDFVKPRAVTLGSAASGENYIAHVHIAFSDPQLIKFIAKSDRKIDDFFYGVTTPTAGYLDDWSALLTAGYILKIKAKGDPDMIAWATSLEKIATDAMVEYKKNTGGTVFDDTAVTRDDATSVDAFMLDQQAVEDYET